MVTVFDVARVSASAQAVDFGKVFRALLAFLVKALVVLIAAAPFAVAWSVTMVVKIAIAGAQEGVRSASAQLASGGGS